MAVLILVFAIVRGQTEIPRRSGTAVVNHIGTIVEWSPEAQAVTGYWRDEMLHGSIDKLVPGERLLMWRKAFALAVDGHGPYPLPVVQCESRLGGVHMTMRRLDDVRIEATLTR